MIPINQDNALVSLSDACRAIVGDAMWEVDNWCCDWYIVDRADLQLHFLWQDGTSHKFAKDHWHTKEEAEQFLRGYERRQEFLNAPIWKRVKKQYDEALNGLLADIRKAKEEYERKNMNELNIRLEQNKKDIKRLQEEQRKLERQIEEAKQPKVKHGDILLFGGKRCVVIGNGVYYPDGELSRVSAEAWLGYDTTIIGNVFDA